MMKVGLHELDHSGRLCVAEYAASATEGEEKEHLIWRQRRPLGDSATGVESSVEYQGSFFNERE